MSFQLVDSLIPSSNSYNEGDRELRKTINSVVESRYPSDNKVMVVVADGNITGKGESMPTMTRRIHLIHTTALEI